MDNQHPIIMVTGDAGTGKGFASIAAALQLRLDKRYGKVMYARNPVQAGQEIGFLAGGLNDKIDPFMMPLYDNLANIETIGGQIVANAAKSMIEIVPLFNLRGRTLENTVLIVDEAQNLDLTMLRTIMKRMGKFSKIIFLGSYNQIDDKAQRRKPKCDYQTVVEAFDRLPYVATIELIQSMRSPWCAEIDKLFSELE